MADTIEIKLTRKLPVLEPEAAQVYSDAMLEMYRRGYDDAKEKLCTGCTYKSYYAQVAAQGDCNDCGRARTCQYVPKPGGIVRINCPLWRGKG